MKDNLTVTGYIQLLASEEGAPGGGSASALAGAQGAALIAMVTRLTLGKKKYEAYHDLQQEIQRKADVLHHRLLELFEEDSRAFLAVYDVLALPKNTDEEKALRKEKMQACMKACTLPPYEVMRSAYEGLLLIDTMKDKSNVNCMSDLGCAVFNLRSAMQGAWLNVLINLGSVEDAAFANTYRQQGAALLQKGLALADTLTSTITQTIEKE